MSTVTIGNSPFHTTSFITSPYGVYRPTGSCKFHTGLDFQSVSKNSLEYPVESGTVVFTSNNPKQSLGCQVQIKGDSGRFWRYCHGVVNSILVSVGQRVDINTPLMREGSTGNVTGPHLHLECSISQGWICGNFINPAEILGIPNETGTIVYFGGEPIPPDPPTPPDPDDPDNPVEYDKKKSRFLWQVYTRTINRRRLNTCIQKKMKY